MQNFHSRLSFVSDTLQKTGLDLVHFGCVLVCVNFGNVMMLHIEFGPYIERASTIRDAHILSMELVSNGFYTTPLMDPILESQQVVRPVSPKTLRILTASSTY